MGVAEAMGFGRRIHVMRARIFARIAYFVIGAVDARFIPRIPSSIVAAVISSIVAAVISSIVATVVSPVISSIVAAVISPVVSSIVAAVISAVVAAVVSSIVAAVISAVVAAIAAVVVVGAVISKARIVHGRRRQARAELHGFGCDPEHLSLWMDTLAGNTPIDVDGET
jgi:hypothetical protein